MTLQDGLDPTTTAILIGFGTLVLAMARKPPQRGLYYFFSGLVWLLSGLTIFTEYGPEWVIVTVGLGLLILFEGAYELIQEVNT